jgi:tetratricopeptide (TPR) repeat protein
MMEKKRSSWIYIVLGVMLFSLITVSALPLLGSVVGGEQFLTDSDREVATFGDRDLLKLEAEADGYQKVLEREPENDTALRGLLQIRLQQKDLKGAIAPLEKLAGLHTEQTEYTILLAQARQQVSDYEGAAAAYDQVLATRPGDMYALGGMASLFLIQDLPERAIALLKNTIQLATKEDNQPTKSIDLASVELLLGEVYAHQERYGDAIALYDRLTKTDQDDFRPILAKALVLEKQGDLEAAKPLLEKAYITAPSEFKDQIGDQMERLVKKSKASTIDKEQGTMNN